MNLKPRLLCTFAHKNDITFVVDSIRVIYDLGSKIYIYKNYETRDGIFCTYNVNNCNMLIGNTISIHRKSETNTLYTINALNNILITINNTLDCNFDIDWDLYRNKFLMNDVRMDLTLLDSL